jgi:hypothetical protein
MSSQLLFTRLGSGQTRKTRVFDHFIIFLTHQGLRGTRRISSYAYTGRVDPGIRLPYSLLRATRRQCLIVYAGRVGPDVLNFLNCYILPHLNEFRPGIQT